MDGQLPPGLPLFPTATGEWCTRSGFVRTVEHLAQLLQLPLLDTMGRNAYGEHVYRVSGARHLISLEMPVSIIMKLARWGSNIILRYLGDAPLRTLTATYLRHRSMVSQRVQHSANLTLAQAHDDDLEEALQDEPEDQHFAFLQHLVTKRIRLVAAEQLEFNHHQSLHTLCSWTANLSNCALLEDRPLGDICKDCRKVAEKHNWVVT